MRSGGRPAWVRRVVEPLPCPNAPPIGCERFPYDWKDAGRRVFHAQNSDDLSIAWDALLAASTSGRGGPLVTTQVAQSRWRLPLARLQHGPELRAWMAALRWTVQCRRVKECVAKL
eukprot:9306561-Pyramimonas_sp.AAC.1